MSSATLPEVEPGEIVDVGSGVEVGVGVAVDVGDGDCSEVVVGVGEAFTPMLLSRAITEFSLAVLALYAA